MKQSQQYNFYLPEYDDPQDVEPVSENFEAIDTTLHAHETELARLERDKATKLALSQHAALAVLDHPDASVTDAKIGTRAVLTTSGALQTLLTAIGNAVKAATGAATWNGAPATTLAAARVHMDDRANIHAVTKAQVGLGNADNTSDAAKPVSTAQAAAIKLVQDDLDAFQARRDNPHAVTKAQVGLGNATNESKTTMFASPTFTGTVTLPLAAPTADTQAAHKGYVDKKVADLVSSAPGTLDTLNELAAALGDDPNFAATTAAQLGGKVDKIAGKGLSANDYDAGEKAANAANTAARHTHGNKSVLDGITAALVTSWNTVTSKLNLSGGTLTGFLTLHAAPSSTMHAATKKYVDDQIAGTGTGDMLRSVYDTNGNGIVDNAEKVNGLTVQTAVPAGAKFTDTVYAHPNSGAAAGTYRSVTINAQGHVTAGTNPTTLAGYGITNAEPAFAKNNAFNKAFGTAAGTVCQGNDARLSNARPANGGTSAACSGNAATATTAQNMDGGSY